MLRDIVECLYSVVEAGAAKIRSVRDGMFRFAVALGLQAAGMLVLVFAIAMFLLAMFWAIEPILGRPIAALLTGGAGLVTAMILVGVAALRR